MIKQGRLATILLTALMPTLSLSAQPIALSRQFRPDPQRYEGSVTGNISLAELGGAGRGCRGFADRQPNFTLTLTNNFPLLDLLAYTKDANSDLTMLVMGDNGTVLCADNENSGRHPQITTRLSQGTYKIWIGTREAGKNTPFTLSLSEIRQK